MKNIKIIIPARFKSSRLPGKPLLKILGKELILHVAEICARVVTKKNLFIATDNKKIFNLVKKYHFNAVITPKSCNTGTDRVYAAAKKIRAKIYVNVQGDEPTIKTSDIKKIIKAKMEYPNHVICGYTKINSRLINNRNIPKVVINNNSDLVYISRAAIPGTKKNKDIFNNIYYKQVCIYAFNYNELKLFGAFKKKGYLERTEDIEIMRYLEFTKKKIKMIKVSDQSLSVDVKSDIKKVVSFLKNK